MSNLFSDIEADSTKKIVADIVPDLLFIKNYISDYEP